MIAVLTSTALKHGSCYECDPTDLRSGDDVIRVFKLGPYVIRLCRVHAQQLVDGLKRSGRGRSVRGPADEDRAMTDSIDKAKTAAYRAARDLTHSDPALTHNLVRSVELTILRRLVSKQLPGGEAEFWRLVEEEIES